MFLLRNCQLLATQEIPRFYARNSLFVLIYMNPIQSKPYLFLTRIKIFSHLRPRSPKWSFSVGLATENVYEFRFHTACPHTDRSYVT